MSGPRSNESAGPLATGEWLNAQAIGLLLKVSERTLCRWRKAGLFKPGVHWRRKFPSPNSPVLYHLERCNGDLLADIQDCESELGTYASLGALVLPPPCSR